jgi:hypothetical protein
MCLKCIFESAKDGTVPLSRKTCSFTRDPGLVDTGVGLLQYSSLLTRKKMLFESFRKIEINHACIYYLDTY